MPSPKIPTFFFHLYHNFKKHKRKLIAVMKRKTRRKWSEKNNLTRPFVATLPSVWYYFTLVKLNLHNSLCLANVGMKTRNILWKYKCARFYYRACVCVCETHTNTWKKYIHRQMGTKCGHERNMVKEVSDIVHFVGSALTLIQIKKASNLQMIDCTRHEFKSLHYC